MKAKTKYRLIDTAGQVTAVVTQVVKTDQQSALARSIMASNSLVEQVGYLQGNNFRMMGGELSINALLAAAYLLNQSGQVNGYSFVTNSSTITLTLPSSLILATSDNLVRLNGITYQVIRGFPRTPILSTQVNKQLQDLAANSRASGLIYYQGSCIKPLVYVPSTNTYVWEKACGSGSLAFSLVTGIREVIQPSGQSINYQINQDNITVTATVKEV